MILETLDDGYLDLSHFYFFCVEPYESGFALIAKMATGTEAIMATLDYKGDADRFLFEIMKSMSVGETLDSIERIHRLLEDEECEL